MSETCISVLTVVAGHHVVHGRAELGLGSGLHHVRRPVRRYVRLLPHLMWITVFAEVLSSHESCVMRMCICVASGLYYLAELVEEYTTIAGRTIRHLILVSRFLIRSSC